MKKFVVCITGASGVIYGLRIVEELSKNHYVYLIVSENGYTVLKQEENLTKNDLKNMFKKNVEILSNNNITAPIASGSRFNEIEGVIIAPCSVGTLGAIASGLSQSLIHRVSDVCLKERKTLYLLVREMPLSLIHIENMRKLTLSGAVVSPASPGFYNDPKTIDDLVNFVVGKVLDFFNVEHSLYRRWRDEDK